MDVLYELKIKTDNFDKVSAAVAEAMQTAITMCGETAEGHAKTVCPVDTGNLRNSISHTEQSFGSEYQSHVGTNVEYAGYVELSTCKMKAQPYLKPAVANREAEYQKIAETIIGAALK